MASTSSVLETGSGPQRSGFLLVRRVAVDKPTPWQGEFRFAGQRLGDRQRVPTVGVLGRVVKFSVTGHTLGQVECENHNKPKIDERVS